MGDTGFEPVTPSVRRKYNRFSKENLDTKF